MFRSIVRIAWLALGVIVGIWVYEALFGIDQRTSLLPFLDGDRETSVIIVGVIWGLVSMLLAATESGRLDAPAPSPPHRAGDGPGH